MKPTTMSNDPLQLVIPFEVKSFDEQTGLFKGYGSTFGNIDDYGDVCEKGCFTETLKAYAKSGGMPNMYFEHDRREPIGEWTEAEETSKGLEVTGRLWIGQGIPKAQQAYLQMKSKGVKALSIGYTPIKWAIDQAKGIRTLKTLDLDEISFTTRPVNRKAIIRSVKSFDEALSEDKTRLELLRRLDAIQSLLRPSKG